MPTNGLKKTETYVHDKNFDIFTFLIFQQIMYLKFKGDRTQRKIHEVDIICAPVSISISSRHFPRKGQYLCLYSAHIREVWLYLFALDVLFVCPVFCLPTWSTL